MSVHSVQEHPAGQWENAEEIDLARYVGALASRWLEILLVTLTVMLLTAAGVLAYRAFTPPIYEATATVAIVRTLTDVRFDARFTTSAEEENLDVNSRRMALIALVDSGDLAQQVIDELGDALPPKLRDPVELLDAVEGEMAQVAGGGQSDLINITVRAESPETAALIANTWAQAYVQQVNRVYGQVSDEMVNTVTAELQTAQQTYAAAQQQLEAHLAVSPLDTLIRQANAISTTLDSAQGAELRMNHEQWLRTNNLLAAARTLGAQVSDSAEADIESLAPALQALQVQVVNAAAAPLPAAPLAAAASLRVEGGGESGQVVVLQQPQQLQPQQAAGTLQFQLSAAAPTSAAALRSETGALIAALEAQLAQLERSIAAGAQTLAADSAAAAGVDATLAQLEDQLRGLQGRIEVENARTLALTAQRDLAWESLQALNNKQAELLLARAAANSEVRLSSAAVPLDKPVEQASLAIALVLAVLVGLLLGMVVALVLEALNVRPLRATPNSV